MLDWISVFFCEQRVGMHWKKALELIWLFVLGSNVTDYKLEQVSNLCGYFIL